MYLIQAVSRDGSSGQQPLSSDVNMHQLPRVAGLMDVPLLFKKGRAHRADYDFRVNFISLFLLNSGQ